MGVMTAYASYNPITQNVALDEKVISFLDVGVSLLSGFTVYSVLGHLEKAYPLGGGKSWYDKQSFGLAFSYVKMSHFIICFFYYYFFFFNFFFLKKNVKL